MLGCWIHPLFDILAELRRRSVFRVAASYLVVMWILLQVAEVTFAPLHFPDWWIAALTMGPSRVISSQLAKSGSQNHRSARCVSGGRGGGDGAAEGGWEAGSVSIPRFYVHGGPCPRTRAPRGGGRGRA